jgi:hypothetical protein
VTLRKQVLQIYVYHILPLMTTNAISSNPAHDEIRSIQQYVIEFASDLREVGSFLWVLRFRPPIKPPCANNLNMTSALLQTIGGKDELDM